MATYNSHLCPTSHNREVKLLSMTNLLSAFALLEQEAEKMELRLGITGHDGSPRDFRHDVDDWGCCKV